MCALQRAQAPPQCVVRATEVSLAQTEIAFITLYEPASTTARVLSRLAVAAHHATTHGLGPPRATNQWSPRAKHGRAVARGQTARLSAGKVLFRVHCDHLDHGCSPRRLKIWVRGKYLARAATMMFYLCRALTSQLPRERQRENTIKYHGMSNHKNKNTRSLVLGEDARSNILHYAVRFAFLGDTMLARA